jgi:hypothetical protein
MMMRNRSLQTTFTIQQANIAAPIHTTTGELLGVTTTESLQHPDFTASSLRKLTTQAGSNILPSMPYSICTAQEPSHIWLTPAAAAAAA